MANPFGNCSFECAEFGSVLITNRSHINLRIAGGDFVIWKSSTTPADQLTVGRIRKEPPAEAPNHPPVEKPTALPPGETPAERCVTADYPTHVWHVDLTVVPIAGGLSAPW